MTPGQEQQLRKLRGLEESLDPSLLVHRALTSGSMTSVIKDTLKGNPGKDGYTPQKGLDYFTQEEVSQFINYIQSRVKNGEDGTPGAPGKNAVSPVRGIDYWTSKDVEEIKNYLLTLIPKPEEKKPIDIQSVVDKSLESLSKKVADNGSQVEKILRDPRLRILLHGGGGAPASFIDGEIPSGTINGINTVFTMSRNPTIDSLKVYLNGLRLTNTVDYTYSGSILTMTTIPFPGDIFLLDFRY